MPPPAPGPEDDDARFTVDSRHTRGAQIGDHNVQYNSFVGGGPPAVFPHLVGRVPPSAVDRVDRAAETALEQALTRESAAACQVIAGLGGVGKTQLAAGLAHRWWTERRVDLLVWVTAATRTGVQTRYAQAFAEVTGTSDEDPARGAERFLAWLAKTDRSWLVVLDDVAEPADLRGLWPPAAAAGHTVVTTRRRDAALLDGRALVAVGVFTEQEALGYLRHKLGHLRDQFGDRPDRLVLRDRPDRLAEAAQLVQELGRLPLALAQAAAYMADQGLSCTQYRRRLAQRRLDRVAPRVLPDEQEQQMARAWSLSLDLADADTVGLASPVLAVTSVLDANGMPLAVLRSGPVVAFCADRLGHEIDADDVEDAVRALHRLSLVDVEDITGRLGDGAVRVHALVQRVTRENEPGELMRAAAVAAADALLTVWPEIERDSGHAQPLRASTTALAATIPEALWTAEQGAHPVLFRAGASLGGCGLAVAARDYFSALADQACKTLATDHPDTLSARQSLAGWRGEAGDASGAAAAFAELLADRLRRLEVDHPDVLATRAKLARWSGEAGDPSAAADAFAELLTDRLRLLGADHPRTLATRHSLAYWRGVAGDPSGAAAAFAELFIDRLRVLGADHPATLTTRANLARWRGEAGDTTGAVTAFTEILADRLRILGADHPRTLISRGDLASWRGQAGDAAGAAAAFAELLTDRLRILGADHPRTLITRGDLARWRGEAGDAAGAAAAFAELVTDRLRISGADHPRTLSARQDLAYWRAKAHK